MTLEQQRWQRAAEIFDATADLPASEREERLDQLCADDAALRAQVEKMLAADASHVEPFMGDAVHWSDELAAEASVPPVDLRGRRIGAWQIVDTVGRGGMGVVHEVQRDDDAYRQRAALKLIRLDADSPVVRERFLRERQTLAQLQHPGIATLLDGGFTEDGWPYFVMEYVDGQPIDTWCDARGLDLRERVRLLDQVLDAVQYAHRNLVVHRDLKPSNILVDNDGRIKLVDFGIAKQLQGPDAATLGERALTLEYASPEQLNAAPITTATDIWQLGIVLYRLLAGVHPFGITPDTPLARQMQQLDREPEPLARAATRASMEAAQARGYAPGTLVKALRGDLSRIVQGCLQRAPEHRYSSVGALADDLRRWREHRPLRIVAPGRWKIVGLWVRRNRALAAVIGSATLAVLAGAGVAFWQADVARQQSANAQEALQFLSDTLTAAAPEQAMASQVSVRELLDKARQELDKRKSVAAEVRGPVERMLGDLYQSVGEPQIAVSLYEAGLRGPEPRGRDEALRLAGTWSEYAAALGSLERGQDSLAAAEHAAALRRRFAGNEPHQELLALLGLGYGHYYADHDDQARELWLQAIALARQMPDPPLLPVVEAYYMAAGVEADLGKPAQAVLLADQALAHADAGELPAQSPWRINILRSKTAAQLRSGDSVGAEATIRQAVVLAEQSLDGKGDLSSKVYSQLGTVLRHQDRYNEALAAHQQAIEAVTDGTPVNAAIDLDRLASIHKQLGDYPKALELFEQSLAQLDKAEVPADDRSRRRIQRNYANCLIPAGRHAQADALLQSLQESATRIEGEDSMEYIFVVWQRMLLAQRRSDAKAMQPLLEDLRPRLGSRFAPEHSLMTKFLHAESLLAKLQGDLASAGRMQREVIDRFKRDGSSALDIARIQSDLADIHFEQGENDKASEVLTEALPVLRDVLLPQEIRRAEAEALALKLGL